MLSSSACARRACGHPSAGRALAVLVFGHWQNIERRMRVKIPAAHVEDLTGDVIADAIASAFEAGPLASSCRG
jgi:hypothetical protein